jgi:hypothetical protein
MMPQLEEAIYAHLSTFAGLTALTGLRIYPTQAPQGAMMPYVVFQRISTIRWAVFGYIDTGLARPRVQFNTWAATATVAKTVKEQVRHALQGWHGVVAGVEILRGYIVDERDLFEQEKQEAGMSETGAFGVGLDVFIPYREV